MTDDIRRRAACDRCHSQKIRCPRQPGQTTCSRCMKAGTPCIFRPFRQKKHVEEDYGPAVTSSQNIATERGVAVLSKRRRVGSQEPSTTQCQSQSNSNLTPPLEPFNVDDLNLDWLPEPYPFSQDGIDPSFCQINVNHDPFTFPDASQTGIFASLAFDPNPQVQHRREANLARSLKNTSKLLINADNTPPPPRLQDVIAQSSTRWFPPLPIHEPQSSVDCIMKVSQLSIDLYKHYQTIPPLSIHDPDPPEGEEVQHPDYSSYVLEETFRLTQNLIDVYPSFLHTFLNNNSTSTSPSDPPPRFDWTSTTSPTESSINTPPSATSPPTHPQSTTTTPPPPSSSYTPPNPSKKPPLDHSAIFLLLSCHLRIIDIYAHLFKHMEVCISQRGIPLNKRQVQIQTPQVAIGSYCPPPSSAVPMQMLLLIQFASQLYCYAGDLVGELESYEGVPEPVFGGEGEGEGSTMKLTKAAAENVKSRASSMTQELGTMRSIMLHSGMLA